jgi:hypothetical protein
MPTLHPRACASAERVKVIRMDSYDSAASACNRRGPDIGKYVIERFIRRRAQAPHDGERLELRALSHLREHIHRRLQAQTSRPRTTAPRELHPRACASAERVKVIRMDSYDSAASACNRRGPDIGKYVIERFIRRRAQAPHDGEQLELRALSHVREHIHRRLQAQTSQPRTAAPRELHPRACASAHPIPAGSAPCRRFSRRHVQAPHDGERLELRALSHVREHIHRRLQAQTSQPRTTAPRELHPRACASAERVKVILMDRYDSDASARKRRGPDIGKYVIERIIRRRAQAPHDGEQMEMTALSHVREHIHRRPQAQTSAAHSSPSGASSTCVCKRHTTGSNWN